MTRDRQRAVRKLRDATKLARASEPGLSEYENAEVHRLTEGLLAIAEGIDKPTAARRLDQKYSNQEEAPWRSLT